MKENKNNQKQQAGLVEKVKENPHKATTEPSEIALSLQKFVVKVVRDEFPETDFKNIEEVNQAFMELHLDIADSLKMVEKLLGKFITNLNTNPMVGKLIQQLNNMDNPQSNGFDSQSANSYQREKSIKTIASFFERNHFSDEKLNQFQTTLAGIVRPISQNDIDDNILDSILKLVNLDSDIEQNYKKGVLDGRNQKIEEQITQYLTNDGLYGNGAANPTTTPKAGYIERLLGSRK